MSNLTLSTRATATGSGPRVGQQLRGIPDLWHFAAEYLLLLPVGAFIGLVWANTSPESYFRTVFALDFFVNEIGSTTPLREVRDARSS